jgi:hypothetical protein
MKKIVMCLAGLLMLSGCATSGKVGKEVPSSFSGCSRSQNICNRNDQGISISYKINKTAKGFTVNGTAIMSRSDGDEYRRSTFDLILVKNRIIVSEIKMAASGGDTGKSMNFSGSFPNTDFDSSGIGFHLKPR